MVRNSPGLEVYYGSMKPRITPLLIGAFTIFIAIAVRAQQPGAPRTAGGTLDIEPLTSPAAANTVEPQLTTENGRTILSWLELAGTRTTLKFAERTSTGWTEPRTVAEGTDFMVNSADVPSVTRLPSGTLVATWLQQDGPDPEAYKLRLSTSTDEGHSWSQPINPHRDKVQTQHGFASIFPTPNGGFGVVWLDGRAIPADAPEGVGNMALRSAMFDQAGKQLNESVVDARVCECCPTSAAATSDGAIVAYRNRSAGEVRDIYVTRLAKGRWLMPVPVHRDGWVVRACPVNGPAISASGRDVAVAWFTAKGGTGHTFLAFSNDGGGTFAPPVRVDDASSLGRVGVLLLDDGSAVVTWVEFANEKSTFQARRVTATGERGSAVRIADSSGTRYPRLAKAPNGLLFAWTETDGDTQRVKTAQAAVR